MSIRKTLFLGGLVAAGYHLFAKKSNDTQNEKQKSNTSNSNTAS